MMWRREWCPAMLAGALALASAVLTGAHAQQAGRTGQVDLLYIRGEWSGASLPLSDASWPGCGRPRALFKRICPGPRASKVSRPERRL